MVDNADESLSLSLSSSSSRSHLFNKITSAVSVCPTSRSATPSASATAWLLCPRMARRSSWGTSFIHSSSSACSSATPPPPLTPKSSGVSSTDALLLDAKYVSNISASTTVTSVSNRVRSMSAMPDCSASWKVARMLRGSETPDISTTMCLKGLRCFVLGLELPLRRSLIVTSSEMLVSSSSLSAQQAQPFSSWTSPLLPGPPWESSPFSMALTSFPSMLTSATSLTTMPTGQSPDLFSSRCVRSVVFPDPRNPEITVMGMMPSSLSLSVSFSLLLSVSFSLLLSSFSATDASGSAGVVVEQSQVFRLLLV
mmetsp:Transcript_13553/g.38129  ORF Transcript_13553/g.38129 Transcript_13553/m.38129 type:complete len:311 (-) Transcript_13553:551-1483(-)